MSGTVYMFPVHNQKQVLIVPIRSVKHRRVYNCQRFSHLRRICLHYDSSQRRQVLHSSMWWTSSAALQHYSHSLLGRQMH